ncbi:unnamed protein product [Symbiodinium natans]|uniref:Uncharacterized protein n=1 Tax=Symbiodinium natans TaxID=878477 RepID=A0A812RU95_9DINO|nr:unnamed protein product [Symbiodinium natans]
MTLDAMPAEDEIPPPPVPFVAAPRVAARGKLDIAAAFNAAHAEGCECCLPKQSALKPGFWQDVGFGIKAETSEGQIVRETLIREVEEEAQAMSPIERTAAIFGWKRAGDMALEDEQNMDGAGDCYARGLAFGAVLGEADGLDAFPAWYPRKEVHKLCAEVLARAALLDRNPLVCLICVSVVLQYTVQSPAVVDAVIEARQELKLAEEKGSKAFGSTAKGGDCSRVRNQQWHTMPTMPTMPFAQAFSCSPVLGSDFGEQICCFKFKLRFLDGMTSHANIGTEGL